MSSDIPSFERYLKKYSSMPGDGNTEWAVMEEAEAYTDKLTQLIKQGTIDSTRVKRILDIECGRGPVTIAALNAFPPAEVVGVDIDDNNALSSLTEEQRKRAFFAHDAIQLFVRKHVAPFDLVLTGFVWLPGDLNYSALYNRVSTGGLVIELWSHNSDGFGNYEMEKSGFVLIARGNRNDFYSSNIWKKE